MKYLSQLFLMLSVLFIQDLYSQSTVYVKTNQFGRGFLKMRGSECFVITPEHVIKNYNGPIILFGNGGVSSRAQLKKAYLGDLAILEFSGENNLNCNKWQLDKNYKTIIENISQAYLELRNDDGSASKITVNTIDIDVQNITIQPKEGSGETFSKGMSGSSLFVEYQGKKVFLGMLQSIADTKTGSVIRADVIDNLLGSFFNPIKKKKTSSVISEQVLTKEEQGFKFDLLGINKSGDRVIFTFDVTSLHKDKTLKLSYRDIFLHEDNGAEHKATKIIIGNKSSHIVEYNLIHNVAVPMKIIFTDIASSSQFATWFKLGFYSEEKQSHFEFRELYFGDESEDLSEVIEDKGNWSKEVLGFKYDLLNFEKNGTDVVFTFTVTSLDKDNEIKFSYRDILLYDNNGLETNASTITVGNKSYHSVDYNLIQGIHVPLIISFKDVASSATGVALLKIGFSDTQNKSNFQIRNLTFPLKKITNTENKVSTSIGKPTTTCSEIYFYRKKSMLECVETVYLYNQGVLLAKLQPGVRYKSIVCDDRFFKLSVRTNPNEIALSASKPIIEMGKKYYFKISCAMGVSTISEQEDAKGKKDITNNSKFIRKLATLSLPEY